jgi:uncharacterized protein YbbC (DUF1343 family)
MRPFYFLLILALATAGGWEGRAATPAGANAAAVTAPPPAKSTVFIPQVEAPSGVMLGIDVVEAGNFVALRGKRIGLLTHGAGVDRHGVSTVDVLRHAPGVKLVALYAVEHGLYGLRPAEHGDPNQVDARSGLIVHSLYLGTTLKPTKAQLQGIDALVIDLQDIGVRSYTFAGSMKLAMAGCFENNVEVIVLDRPNPLGGLKVDGPLLDSRLHYTGVAEFPVPYVHGLTIGELAELAAKTPGVLEVPEAVRLRGRLQVIRMSGWKRTMRWPETGLTWVPTSPAIQDFAAVMGYAMTGLGCYLGNFKHGVGNQYLFRGIYNLKVKPEIVERELRALQLPGLNFRRVSVPSASTGQPATGLYIEVSDWDAWRPTELSFYLMKLACKLEPRNPFAFASKGEEAAFLQHMGSVGFFRDLVANGARVDVERYLRQWQAEDQIYQEQSSRFWLYH